MIVTCEETAAVLRAVATGAMDLRVVGQSWQDVFAGEVTFRLGDGTTLVVFNDCDDLDYVDAITMPDGRHADFDTWAEASAAAEHLTPLNPIDALTPEEGRALYDRLLAAQGADPSWWLERT